MLNALPQDILTGILFDLPDSDVCSLKRTCSTNFLVIEELESDFYWKQRFEVSIGCSIPCQLTEWKFSYIAYRYTNWTHTIDSICNAIVVSITTDLHYKYLPACVKMIDDSVIEEFSQNRVTTVLDLAKLIGGEFHTPMGLGFVIYRAIALWYLTDTDMFQQGKEILEDSDDLMGYVCDSVAVAGDVSQMDAFLSEHGDYYYYYSTEERVIKHLVAQDNTAMIQFVCERGLVDDETRALAVQLYIEKGVLNSLKEITSDGWTTDITSLFDTMLECSDREIVEYAITVMEEPEALLKEAICRGNAMVVELILDMEDFMVEVDMTKLVDRAHRDGFDDIARMILYHPTALEIHELDKWSALVRLIPR